MLDLLHHQAALEFEGEVHGLGAGRGLLLELLQPVLHDGEHLLVHDDELVVLEAPEVLDHLVPLDEEQEVASVVLVEVGGQLDDVL